MSSDREVAQPPAAPTLSRRSTLGVAGIGISTLVLPPAAAAATPVTLAPTGTSSDLEGTWTSRTVTSGGGGAPDGADQGVKGIATNGTSIFWRRGDARTVVREVALDGTFVADHTIDGASTANILSDGDGGFDDARNELAVSGGYLFQRSESTLTVGGARLYAMRITPDATWALTDVTIPAGQPLLSGRAFMTGNLLDLPDGRLGVVSAPTGTSGDRTSTLRLYTVDISAAPAGAIVLTWSEDIALPDSDAAIYPSDCHGVASDGTFLHRLDWGGASGYRSRTWELPTSGSTATRVSAPGYTASSNNPTYMARNHVTGDYLIGNFQNGGARFFTT